MKRPELLSPAGNMECLIAAIEGGCDAVYLGGYAFGARSFAGNFSNEELEEAIQYAHLYGVKIYVTVNTIVYENEVECFLEYIDFLHKNHVDAVIMQDLGMIDLVRKTYPKFEIHASTQMHIHNLEGTKLVENLGLHRVVLARETDIDTLNIIKKNTNIELEIFVHGALCICYSGQCLMSTLIGGRSGNRGTCSQCCRMPYQIDNETSYVLSPKDLNSLEDIGKLIEIGIDSFKIEGRMKRPEYVYYVTSLYRKAIDQYLKNKKIEISHEEILILKKLFHREFTKGFLFHEEQLKLMNHKRPNHIGIPIGKVIQYENKRVTVALIEPIHQEDGIRILSEHEDSGCTLNKIYQNKKLVNSAISGDIISFDLNGPIHIGDVIIKTSDFLDLKMIQEHIHSKTRKVEITGFLKGKIGGTLTLELCDGIHTVSVTSVDCLEPAKTKPVFKEQMEVQLSKLGNTVYHMNVMNIDVAEGFISLQALNVLRREAILRLNEVRLYKLPYQKETYHMEVPEYLEENGYTVEVDSMESYEEIKNRDWKQIYINEAIYDMLEDVRKVKKIPRVVNESKKEKNPILAGELGTLYQNGPLYTDFSLNVVNSYTVAFLHKYGVHRVTLSYELDEKQIETLIHNYQKRYHKQPNLEYIVSSYPEVMITKWNPTKDYFKLNTSNMKDLKGNLFFMKFYPTFTQIYYHKKIEHKNHSYYFDLGIHTLRISTIKPTYKM